MLAQLHVGGGAHGVHALVVRLRDSDGSAAAGITIADCGHKMGLLAVDNGRFWFDHVKVPRGNLLDRCDTIWQLACQVLTCVRVDAVDSLWLEGDHANGAGLAASTMMATTVPSSHTQTCGSLPPLASSYTVASPCQVAPITLQR